MQAGTGGASRGWNFEGDLEATWAHRNGPCFGGCLSVGQPERAVPCLGTPEAGPKGKRETGESRLILRGRGFNFGWADCSQSPNRIVFSLGRKREGNSGGVGGWAGEEGGLVELFSPVPCPGPWQFQLVDFLVVRG